MKLQGLQPRSTYQTTFTLPRPNGERLVVTMQPLALGFQRRLRERGVFAPTPSARIARDAAGRPIRDDSGQAVTFDDEHDRDYLDQLEQYHQRIAVLTVVESLLCDPGVKFETPPPEAGDGWNDYADTLFQEMEEAGLTAGDLVQLCTFACQISNLSGSHLQQAEADFSTGPYIDTG